MAATRKSRHGRLLAAVVVVVGYTGGAGSARADVLVNCLTEHPAPGARVLGPGRVQAPADYQPHPDQEAEDGPEPADVRTPELEAAEAELFRQLDAGLASLPPEQRSAFVLAEIHEVPLQEIAQIEGVRLGTVKSRLSRAKEKLRSFFRHAAGHR